MRNKLNFPELFGLKERIKLLLKSAPYETASQGRRYFSINTPHYCEAFGMLHALEVLGLGTLAPDSRNPKPLDLHKWFDEIVEEVLQARQ